MGVAIDAGVLVAFGTGVTEQVQLRSISPPRSRASACWRVAVSPAGSRMSLRPAAFAGTFALGIYVLHAPVLGVLQGITGTTTSPSVLVAVLLGIISFGVALLVSVLASKIKPLAPLFK